MPQMPAVWVLTCRVMMWKTTKKSPESEIAKTIILTCDVARSLPSRVHVT